MNSLLEILTSKETIDLVKGNISEIASQYIIAGIVKHSIMLASAIFMAVVSWRMFASLETANKNRNLDEVYMDNFPIVIVAALLFIGAITMGIVGANGVIDFVFCPKAEILKFIMGGCK